MAELKLQQSRLDGRYDIVECLGRGSYAEIYVAHDNSAPEGGPETVVIKALNVFLQDAPDADLEHTLVTNFQNEAVALDRVRHPNIISRLGHGTAIDLTGITFHYLVLEYLSGGDMHALARSHPLSMDQALFYLEQVCSGLAHAHDCGVIHRDIKPHNLLLTADRRVVKIADFGVARLEAMDGAITRVGTNVYSAPEHNPLVQTGQLDTGALLINRQQLTPAADIYSLAKTTYTLLAGESPRRFAQHPIRELPEAMRNHFWSQPILRVLEKATQTRPDQRYQTVQSFWDDFAEAALPPTRLLNEKQDRKPSADLAVQPDEFPKAAPQAKFAPVSAQPESAFIDAPRRPKIVVPVVGEQAKKKTGVRSRIAEAAPAFARDRAAPRRPVPNTRKRNYIVAGVLVLAFAVMLLATHKYVTSHWNPFVNLPMMGEVFVIGREGVTTTDVNLRSGASSANATVGLAENGSRVKVLSSSNNWYEVQVLQHGRPKTDPFTSDRGWINKRFVKFD
ncbi:MAG TPA: protein kinase [Pyrinomonadaceae bacterium]|nr:protein kinase [Pyrinomonadaceae bacterium]